LHFAGRKPERKMRYVGNATAFPVGVASEKPGMMDMGDKKQTFHKASQCYA